MHTSLRSASIASVLAPLSPSPLMRPNKVCSMPPSFARAYQHAFVSRCVLFLVSMVVFRFLNMLLLLAFIVACSLKGISAVNNCWCCLCCSYLLALWIASHLLRLARPRLEPGRFHIECAEKVSAQGASKTQPLSKLSFQQPANNRTHKLTHTSHHPATCNQQAKPKPPSEQ